MKMATVKVMGEVHEPDGDEAKGTKYDDYELEDAARTLARAEEIKADAGLMKAVQPHLEKKAKAHKGLNALRKKGMALAKAGK